MSTQQCKRCKQRAAVRATVVIELLPPHADETKQTSDNLCAECANAFLVLWGEWVGDDMTLN